MLAQTESPAPSAINQARRQWTIVLPFIVVVLFLWRFSTLPSYHPNTNYPADWTPGCPQWETTWHTVAIPQLDRASCGMYRTQLDVPGKVLLLSRSPGLGEQFAVYDIATGTREAESNPMPRLTDSWLHDGILMQIPPRTTGWPVISLSDPVTLQVTRTIPLSGDPDLLSKLPANIGFRNVTFTESNELRMLAYMPGSGSRNGRYFWIAADATGRITSFRQTPEKMNIVWAWPVEHPTMLLFAEDHRDTSPTLAWDYLTGLEIPVPAYDPADQYGYGYNEADPPRLAPVSLGRLPFRITDGISSLPNLAAEASIPRQFVPPANHSLLIPQISGIQWVPVMFERLRYLIWDLRYSEVEIARQAERSIRVDGLALSMEVDDPATRAITGDLLDTMRIELARGYVRESFAEPSLSFSSTNRAGDEQFSIYAGSLTDLKTVAMPDGRMLIVQPITAPTPIANAPNGLLRVGVLPVDASEVHWLGYVDLPPDPAHAQGSQLYWLNLMRVGDQLLCSYGGRHFSGNGYEPDSHSDLYWTAFPLPPEFADLPEGQPL